MISPARRQRGPSAAESADGAAPERIARSRTAERANREAVEVLDAQCRAVGLDPEALRREAQREIAAWEWEMAQGARW